MDSSKNQPKSIDDLKAAPYNPRFITDEALEGLQVSVSKFGDLSGIVWNQRTGHLVAGHQRLKALKGKGAQFLTNPPRLVLGDSVFSVRVVDWDEKTEKAANLTANNAFIAGRFTEEALPILEDDLKDFDGLQEMRLDRIADILPTNTDDIDDLFQELEQEKDEDGSEDGFEEPYVAICPECGHEFVLDGEPDEGASV